MVIWHDNIRNDVILDEHIVIDVKYMTCICLLLLGKTILCTSQIDWNWVQICSWYAGARIDRQNYSRKRRFIKIGLLESLICEPRPPIRVQKTWVAR